MSKYSALEAILTERAAAGLLETTLPFAEVDHLVGGLPASARDHQAWWGNGGHSQANAWLRPGWKVDRADLTGQWVRFVRMERQRSSSPPAEAAAPGSTPVSRATKPVKSPDVVLVGCVKTKRSEPAPARDLYTSPLFVRRRAYADARGVPWFILSAEHGLLEQDQIVAPYDLALKNASTSYRREWGRRVVEALQEQCGDLGGRTIEVHAGAEYVVAIDGPLRALGARVTWPLQGLSLGPQLHWYDRVAE